MKPLPSLLMISACLMAVDSSVRAQEEAPAPSFQREALMIDVKEGGLDVAHVFFPAAAMEDLTFTVPKGTRKISLENGFAEERPMQLGENRYYAKLQPGAFPVIVAYEVRTLGRSYTLKKARDTDAQQASVLIGHFQPAPEVEGATFRGMQNMAQGFYYSFALGDPESHPDVVIRFSGLPMNPRLFQALAVAFGLPLFALLFIQGSRRRNS